MNDRDLPQALKRLSEAHRENEAHMLIQSIAAAVTTARKLGEKTCPKCGMPLERQFNHWQQSYVWAHRPPVDGFAMPDCDYSEPETARKGKR